LSIFVDSSLWFAAVVVRDEGNARAKSILRETTDHVTTDHVVVETWLLLNSRYHRQAAVCDAAADFEAAWAIGEAFPDQGFSIVDRTSFAVMERLGISRVASFDNDFAVYRYGRDRDRAFEVLR
jgi:predicted nucleic acid-binding protein